MKVSWVRALLLLLLPVLFATSWLGVEGGEARAAASCSELPAAASEPLQALQTPDPAPLDTHEVHLRRASRGSLRLLGALDRVRTAVPESLDPSAAPAAQRSFARAAAVARRAARDTAPRAAFSKPPPHC